MNKQKRLANKVKKLGFALSDQQGLGLIHREHPAPIPPELKIKALLEEESQMFFQEGE